MTPFFFPNPKGRIQQTLSNFLNLGFFSFVIDDPNTIVKKSIEPIRLYFTSVVFTLKSTMFCKTGLRLQVNGSEMIQKGTCDLPPCLRLDACFPTNSL